MPASHDLEITVREIIPHGDELAGHSQILHGQAPEPEGETQDFHLAISANGDPLLLFREGKLPQALRINELVSAWLLAANRPRRGDIVADDDRADIVRGGPKP